VGRIPPPNVGYSSFRYNSQLLCVCAFGFMNLYFYITLAVEWTYKSMHQSNAGRPFRSLTVTAKSQETFPKRDMVQSPPSKKQENAISSGP